MGCVLYNSGNQTIANTTYAAITWDTEVLDTDGYHSTVTNTQRITIPSGKDGKYFVYGKVDNDNNIAGNQRQLGLNKNGSNIQYASALAGYYGTCQLSIILDLVAGDYIDLDFYQDSGGTRTIYKGASNGRFMAYLIG